MHSRDDSKLYVDDCAELTVDMAFPYGIQIERTIEGRIGEVQFNLAVAIARGHKGWMFACPHCGRRVAAAEGHECKGGANVRLLVIFRSKTAGQQAGLSIQTQHASRNGVAHNITVMIGLVLAGFTYVRAYLVSRHQPSEWFRSTDNCVGFGKAFTVFTPTIR